MADGDFRFWRDERGPHFSFKHTLVEHSDHMDWGYAGPAPADAALNILYRALLRRKYDKGRAANVALAHHHDFMLAFVAPLPLEGGTLPGGQVYAWLDARFFDAR